MNKDELIAKLQAITDGHIVVLNICVDGVWYVLGIEKVAKIPGGNAMIALQATTQRS